MAKANPADKAREPVATDARIARLLGLLAIRDIEDKSEQIALLQRAGFEIGEIAEMLGVTTNYISVATYRAKTQRRTKPRKS